MVKIFDGRNYSSANSSVLYFVGRNFRHLIKTSSLSADELLADKIFGKILRICPAAEISAGNQKGIDNTIIKFHAHNNINESLITSLTIEQITVRIM